LHKERCVPNKEPATVVQEDELLEPPSTAPDDTSNTFKPDITIDSEGILRIPYPVLQLLGQNVELVELLAKPELQRMMRDIDASQERSGHPLVAPTGDREEGEVSEEHDPGASQYKLESYLTDPLFSLAVDMMLKVVGVRDSSGESVV